MKTKKTHLDFIESKGTFMIDCTKAIFSADEIEILERWGHWFEALVSGHLDPITKEQEQFILVGRHIKLPETAYENAWFKYQGRKKLEMEQSEKFELDYHPLEDPFYTREQAKILKRRQFADMAKHHRE